MILGLCGLKNSGKDTVAAYLITRYKFERRAFADPLKQSVARLLDVEFSDIERMKNDPHSYLELITHRNHGETSQVEHGTRISMRDFLQRYGTESHRDVFGKDFWVDQTFPVGGYYQGRKIVVTDVRFDNEVQRVHDIGGQVILVERPDLPNDDNHVSEQPHMLQYDHKLINGGDIQHLHEQIERLLEILYD